MKRERLNIVLIACLGLLLLAVHMDLKAFSLNQQAWDMWRSFGDDPLSALLSGHPHGLRYLVYFPSFAVANLFGAPPDLVFTYVCTLALGLMTMYVGSVVSDLWGYSGYVYKRDLVTVAIFALSVLMNGRMILPFLGYLLVIFAGADWLRHRQWKFDHVVVLCLGVLLTSLSSGALVVAMALAAGIAGVTAWREPALFVRSPRLVVSITLVLMLFAVPTAIGINKNLDYFGGDGEAVLRMLDHGAGGDILEPVGVDADGEQTGDKSAAEAILQYWWVGILLWAAGAWSLGWRPIPMVLSASPGENILHLAAALALAGGLFGYSVLTLSIIPLLILNSGSVASVTRSIKSRAHGLTAPRRG